MIPDSRESGPSDQPPAVQRDFAARTAQAFALRVGLAIGTIGVSDGGVHVVDAPSDMLGAVGGKYWVLVAPSPELADGEPLRSPARSLRRTRPSWTTIAAIPISANTRRRFHRRRPGHGFESDFVYIS
jgi:hypothetical protein